MIYAIIGYEHRGCEHRLKNLKLVLQYYQHEDQVHLLLVTNIPKQLTEWCATHGITEVTFIEHQQTGQYSHNETLMVGLEHAPDGSVTAFMDADVVFIKGSLSASLPYLADSPLVSPRGAMKYANENGKIFDSCIPVGSVVARKELLCELVMAAGGSDIRGWGAEDVALLVAARQRGIFAKRHYVETLHFWHPEAPQAGKQEVLDQVTQALGLPTMNSLEFRLTPIKKESKAQKIYCALRGLGSSTYLKEVCDSPEAMEVHIHSNGRDDYLAQVHYAGVTIHKNDMPCETCARSDSIGRIIWGSKEKLAQTIGTSVENALFNVWYATVALGWNMGAWLYVQSLVSDEYRNIEKLEQLAHEGLNKALNIQYVH